MKRSFNITIIDFQKHYKSKTIMIKDLIISNRVTVFNGKNGAGKSTLLKAIVKLISYQGKIVSSYSFSYMPEHPIFPLDITVEEFLKNLCHESENDYDYNEFLSQYSLKHKIDCKISTLSKGMKTKLNLIQCLSQKVDVYVLDEPLSGLDDDAIQILIEYIRTSNRNFVISSHNVDAFHKLEKEIIYL